MSRRRGEPVTAAEVVGRLRAEGRYEDHRRPAGSTEIDDDERPVVEALRAVGVDTYSVHDLAGAAGHPGARAVLLDHVQRDHPPVVRKRLAAALAGARSRRDFERVVELYRAERDDHVREGFATAVSRSAAGRLDDVVELIRDRSLGGSRVLLVSALRRSRQPRAREVLEGLRDDPDLRAEIERRLGRAAR